MKRTEQPSNESKQPENAPAEPRADETAPGVKLLKQVWNIKTDKPQRESAPQNVAHDIYHVPERKPEVPRRHMGNGPH
jgi:hypothetical protein